MQSKAKTVTAYLRELPPDRRKAIEAVRTVILANIDEGIEEGMSYGMIGYYVPHRVFPAGYHVDPSTPLPYMGLASQKNNLAVYMMFTSMGDGSSGQWLRDEYRRRGRKIDMGKGCLRFRSLADIDLEVLEAVIRKAPTKQFIDMYVAARGASKQPAAKKPAAQRPAAKKPAAKRPAAKK